MSIKTAVWNNEESTQNGATVMESQGDIPV